MSTQQPMVSQVSVVDTAIDCLKNGGLIKRSIKNLAVDFVIDKTTAKVQFTVDEDYYQDKDLEKLDIVLFNLIKDKYPDAMSDTDYKNLLYRYAEKRKILLPGDYLITLSPISMLEIIKDVQSPTVNVITIRVIGKGRKKILKDIMKDIQNDISAKQDEGSKIIKNGAEPLDNKRSIDNIFVSAKVEIISYIDSWKVSEKLYNDIFIPFKTGLLFYGQPGTGKTTFGCAIANHLGWNIVFLQPGDIMSPRLYFPRGSKDKGVVVIIDEIDNWIDQEHQVNSRRGPESVKINLRRFREFIDDLPSNLILIGTTNHKDKLDSSLLRPGRFDKIYEFDNISNKIAREMIAYHNAPLSLLNEFEDQDSINPSKLEKLIIKHSLDKNGVGTDTIDLNPVMEEVYEEPEASPSEDDDEE